MRWLLTLLAVLGLVVGTAAPVSAASIPPVAAVAAAPTGLPGGPAKTSLAGFNAGNIISDAVFTNKSTMTESQIQAFFNSKVKTCRGGSDKYGPIICLKDFRITSVTMPSDSYCKGYTGAKNESAARIIHRVAQSCGINPQVLIVMLQKEQGLVTHTWPSAWRYDIALGQGCPDTAPCDPNFVGFFHQIYGAARQMQLYLEGKHFTWYAPGKTWNILYHPNKSCGTAPVKVANKATSALYYYTPYQPNAAAMKAGYGTGDACSSYGNRNFYNYFTDWFGSTQAVRPGAPTNVRATAGDAEATVTWAAPSNNGGAAITQYRVTAQPGGKVVTTTGATTAVVTGLNNGITYQFTVEATNVAGTSSRSKASAGVTPVDPRVQRQGGATRYDAAVSASQAAFPEPNVPVVYLANGYAYADAAAGAAAAARAGGPVLFTPANSLPSSVSAELERLDPHRVVLIGSTYSISANVESQVRRFTSAVSRQGGPTRFEAAVSVSKESFAASGVPVAYVANGWAYADAAAGASMAGMLGGPLLFTDAQALPTAVAGELARLKPQKIVVLGGTPSVSTAVEQQIKRLSPNVTRQGGATRFDAAVSASQGSFPSPGVPVVFIANGWAYADAAAGAATAGHLGGPLLFTQSGTLPAAVGHELNRLNPQRIVVLGGPPSVSVAVERHLMSYLGG